MVELLWGHGANAQIRLLGIALVAGDCLMLHPVSCTCLATPPAVGHFLSYIRDRFGCYALPFWNVLLRDMCHEKSAWKTNLAVILFQSLVSVWWNRSQVLPVPGLAERESSCVTRWGASSPGEGGHWPFREGLKWKCSCNSICILWRQDSHLHLLA